MSNYNLIVTKKPRDDPIPDIPINFKPFQNLRLDLLEIKDKLKKGLPPIPRVNPSPPKPIQEKHKDRVEEKKKKIPSPLPESKDKKSKQKDVLRVPTKKHSSSDDKSIGKDLGTTSDSDDDEETDDSSESGDTAKSTAESEAAKNIKEDEYDIYAGLSPEEREKKEKEEFLWRFRILKKQYGKSSTIPIPEWNEFSDITHMKTSYERTIRELYLDDAVESYRTYLIGGWMAIEYVSTQILEIDMSGFTNQQIRMMYKYDRYLIELGEKSYSQWQLNLPVEIRLLGMILLQAALFYLGKIIHANYGARAGEMFEGFVGHPPSSKAQNNNSHPQSEGEVNDAPPERKMRGPKIKAEDIRNKANII